MNSIRDFLGSNYALIVAYGLFMVWILAIAFIQNKRKEKNFKSFKKKWWFWLINILLLGFIFFVQFNDSYFGYVTPDNFSKMQVNENEIILFDNRVTYYDDDVSSTNDYTSHLRIHVVDRNTHTKKYEDQIGSNYGTFIDDNNIFVYKFNSGNSNNYSIESVSTYDTDKQDKSLIVETGGTIRCDGNTIDVYSIEVALGIVATSKSGDQYLYNSETERFEEFDGQYKSVDLNTTNPHCSINLVQEYYGSDKKIMRIEGDSTGHSFLFGHIFFSTEIDGQDYALIQAYRDLTKEECFYAFANQQGNIMWEIDLNELEETVGGRKFKQIDLFQISNEVIYFTINAYLFELHFRTGSLNWWLKL